MKDILEKTKNKYQAMKKESSEKEGQNSKAIEQNEKLKEKIKDLEKNNKMMMQVMGMVLKNRIALGKRA